MAVENGTVVKVTVASFVTGVVVGFQMNRIFRGKLRDWLKRLNNNL